MPRVSAIVSAYYAKEYIAGRLENLLEQNEHPEIVVVCQANSYEHQVASDFLGADTLVLTDDIPTVYRAWNLGIAAASGKYVTSANSDDRLAPGALALLADMLDASGAAVAYGDLAIVDRIDGPAVGYFTFAEGGLEELMRGCFLGPCPMWRRSLHTTYGPFDETLHVAGDYDYWLRLAKGGERFVHTTEVIGTYLNRPNSREHREPIRTLVETARVRARYREVPHGQR